MHGDQLCCECYLKVGFAGTELPQAGLGKESVCKCLIYVLLPAFLLLLLLLLFVVSCPLLLLLFLFVVLLLLL